MQVLFIVNELAGNGKGIKIWRRIQQSLTIDYTVELTKYPGHGEQLARQFVAQAGEYKQLIIVVGGDGTIHEVVSGVLHHENTIIAVISAGSGNDFARSFPVFKTAQQIEAYINESTLPTMCIDIGEMQVGNNETHTFVNSAGIGFDAYVTKLVNQSKFKQYLNKVGLGKLSYALIAIASIFTFQRFDLHIRQNGHERIFRQAWFVAVSNHPYFGGGMKISPNSKPNDGEIEMTIVNELSRIKLLLVFATVFFGKHTRFKEITFLNGKSFDIHIQTERMDFYTDGEYIGEISRHAIVQCKVKPGACKLASFTK